MGIFSKITEYLKKRRVTRNAREDEEGSRKICLGIIDNLNNAQVAIDKVAKAFSEKVTEAKKETEVTKKQLDQIVVETNKGLANLEVSLGHYRNRPK